MGSSKTTSTQESKPPSWAKDAYQLSGDETMRLYTGGYGGNPYQGSAVADLSGTTMQGVNQTAQAGQSWNTSGTRPLYQGIGQAAVSDPFVNQLAGVAGNANAGQVGTSGYNQAQNAAGGLGSMADKLLGGIAGGKDGITTDADYRGILERAQQPTSAASNLQGYASGEYLKGEGNPFYRERLEREIADSTALLNSQFSGAGRYGSPGAHQGVVAENASNMLMKGLEEDFNRQTANQFNAVGMIDAANQGALGTQLGAASGITGAQGQNLANRMGASGQMLGAQSDMASHLRGIADSRAGIEAGNADRSLQATGLQGNLLSQAAGLRGQGLDRAQTAANSMAGLDQQQFQNQLAGADATLKAGGILDRQNQSQLTDVVNKFYEMDNADWQRLGLLQAGAAGAAGPYGTQSGTSRTSNPGQIFSALGGAMGGK